MRGTPLVARGLLRSERARPSGEAQVANSHPVLEGSVVRRDGPSPILLMMTLLLLFVPGRLRADDRPATSPGGLQPQLFATWSAPADAQAEATSACGAVGTQPSGALYQICMPTGLPWNGELVVYAHGYVSPTAPLAISHEAAFALAALGQTGRAFATTSYRSNGLAVLDAMEDLRELVGIFTVEQGAPARIYLVGASLGGLIATLAVEREPETYDGALAMCGPYGSLAAEMDYLGDFRVVFDYLFPELLPPSAVSIPGWLMESWASHYETTVRPVVEDAGSAALVTELLAVTGGAFDPDDPATRQSTVAGVLWYNVFATNEAAARLGGQSFDNESRVYQGSTRDDALNAGVARFSADPVARAELVERYETTGRLERPLVTIHTTGDQIVPYWHASRYAEKVAAQGQGHLYDHFRVERYGHCTVEPVELQGAFDRLVALTDLQN